MSDDQQVEMEWDYQMLAEAKAGLVAIGESIEQLEEKHKRLKNLLSKANFWQLNKKQSSTILTKKYMSINLLIITSCSSTPAADDTIPLICLHSYYVCA